MGLVARAKRRVVERTHAWSEHCWRLIAYPESPLLGSAGVSLARRGADPGHQTREVEHYVYTLSRDLQNPRCEGH